MLHDCPFPVLLRWATSHKTGVGATPDQEEGVPLGRKAPILASSERCSSTQARGGLDHKGILGGGGTSGVLTVQKPPQESQRLTAGRGLWDRRPP